MPREIVLASGNRGKLAELAAVLATCDVSVRPQADFDVPEADEDGLTFVENALKKARNDAQNLAKLLQDMADVPDAERQCRFICVIAFLRHADDPTPIICQGEWAGAVLRAPRGHAGFGYDPVFHVPGRDCTAAELDPAVKNSISHRGRALGEFVRAFQRLYVPDTKSPR